MGPQRPKRSPPPRVVEGQENSVGSLFSPCPITPAHLDVRGIHERDYFYKRCELKERLMVCQESKRFLRKLFPLTKLVVTSLRSHDKALRPSRGFMAAG